MSDTVKTRKYILIPEYAPLYAMAECYGPPHGPLPKPTPTPVSVIGKLLKQDPPLTVMEVVRLENDTGKIEYSAPVKLTLDNYTLSYEDITAGKVIHPDKITEIPTQEIVKPTVVETPVEEVTPQAEEETTEPEPAPVEEQAEPEQKDNPYAGLTKAQRRAKRREEAAQRAAAEAVAEAAAEEPVETPEAQE